MQTNKTMAEVYKNGSDEVKKRLREAFPASELGITPSQQEFDEVFLEILRRYRKNVRLLDGEPMSRYEIFDEDGRCLFDVSYDSENPHFWYSWHRIYLLFNGKFGFTYQQISEMMRPVLERELGMRSVTPNGRVGKFKEGWKGSLE